MAGLQSRRDDFRNFWTQKGSRSSDPAQADAASSSKGRDGDNSSPDRVDLEEDWEHCDVCGDMTGIASGEGEQGTSQHMQRVAEKSGGGREVPAEDMNDLRFWDRVGPLLFHSVRAAARLARPAAPAGAAAAPWPCFSGNVRLFSAFRDEWRRVRESVKSPPSDDAECEIF